MFTLLVNIDHFLDDSKGNLSVNIGEISSHISTDNNKCENL